MIRGGIIYWASGFAAVAAVAAGGALWRHGQSAIPARAPISAGLAIPPTPDAAGQPGPSVQPITPGVAPEPVVQAVAPSVAPAPEAPPPAGPRPRFDVVRVEPTGEAVIAGRAAPRARVAVTDGGLVVAEADADGSGQFVILPPDFAPGSHALGLTARVGDGAALESPGVVGVEVPRPAPAAKFAAASIQSAARPPAKPAVDAAASVRALGSPTALSGIAGAAGKGAAPVVVARTGASDADPAPRTAITGVAADQAGRVVVTGAAPPGAFLRLYLNGALLANVTAGADGLWSLTVEHGMTAGPYAIRADEIDASAAVLSRAEVPFNYRQLGAAPAAAARPPAPAPPAIMAAAPAPPAAPAAPAVGLAPAGDGAHAVVRLVDTRKVIRGDSLWGISERLYGDGLRYTQIYAANVAQIRNPRLIYPGQVFVLPQPF
jgi:nucleoid-associated protein YgaU